MGRVLSKPEKKKTGAGSLQERYGESLLYYNHRSWAAPTFHSGLSLGQCDLKLQDDHRVEEILEKARATPISHRLLQKKRQDVGCAHNRKMYSRNNAGHPANSQPQYLTQSARVSTELAKSWGVIDSEARSYSVAIKSDSSSPTTFSIPAVTTEHEFGRFSLFPGSPNVPAGQAQTYFSSVAPRNYGALASSPSFSTSFLRNHLGQVHQNVGSLHMASTWNIGGLGKAGSNDHEQVQRMQSSPGFSATWPRVNGGGGGAGDKSVTIARLRQQVRELTAQLHERRAKAQEKFSARDAADQNHGSKVSQKEDGNSALAVRVRVDEGASFDQGSSSTPMSPVSSSLVTKIGDLKQKIVNGLIVMGESDEQPAQADSELAASDSDLAEKGLCANCRRTSSDEVSFFGDDDDDAFPGFRTPTMSESGEDTQDQEAVAEKGEVNLEKAVEDSGHTPQSSLESEGGGILFNEVDALDPVGPDQASETSLDTSAVVEGLNEMDASESVGTDNTSLPVLDTSQGVESSNEVDGSELVETDDTLPSILDTSKVSESLTGVDSESVGGDYNDEEGGSEANSDAEVKPFMRRRKVSIEHPPNWRIEGWISKNEEENQTIGIESSDINTADSDFIVQHSSSIDKQADEDAVEGVGEDGGQWEEEQQQEEEEEDKVEPQEEEADPNVGIDEAPLAQSEENCVIESPLALNPNENPPPYEAPEPPEYEYAQEYPDAIQNGTSPEGDRIGSIGSAILSASEDLFMKEEVKPVVTEDSSDLGSFQEDPIFDDDSETTIVENQSNHATSDTEEIFDDKVVETNDFLRVAVQEDLDARSLFSSASEESQASLNSDNEVSLGGADCEPPIQEGRELDITGNLFDSMDFVQTISDLEDGSEEWSSRHSCDLDQDAGDVSHPPSDIVSNHSVDEEVHSILDEHLPCTHVRDAEESSQQSECGEPPDSFWEGFAVDEGLDQIQVEPSAGSISAASIVEIQVGGEPEEPLFQNASRETHPEVDREETEEPLGVTLANGIGCVEDSDSDSSVDMTEVESVVSRELSMRMAKGMQLSSFPIDHGSDVSDFSE